MYLDQGAKSFKIRIDVLTLFFVAFGIFFLGGNPVLAQGGRQPLGARSAAMGYASTALPSAFNVFDNIAGVGEVEQATAMFTYYNRYGVEAFRSSAAGCVLPISSFRLGFTVSRFGDALFNETVGGIGAAHRIGAATLGLKANVVQYGVKDLYYVHTFTFDFGAQVKLSEKVGIGGKVSNMTRSRLTGEIRQELPSYVSLGMMYSPHKKVKAILDVDKETQHDLNIRAGIEFELIKALVLRSGFNTFPSSVNLGAGFRFKRIEADYAFQNHPRLGMSQQLSLTFKFGKLKDGGGEDE